MSKQSNLTVKGQVTIPKDVRDALGLKPGEPVEFDWNDAGEAVIRKPRMDDKEYQRRYAATLAALNRVREMVRPYQSGRATDDIMDDLRGSELLP